MSDLTTLAAVKQSLALTPAAGSGSDAVLQTLITATSADFLRAIRRTDFMSASYIEVREGEGQSRLSMRHWPITAVASVKVAGVVVASSSDGILPGYTFDLTLDPERCSQLYFLGAAAPQDGASIVVSYTAGYTVQPPDVDQAIVDWVVARYRGRPSAQVGAQRDVSGENIKFDKPDAMPPTTAGVVERYMRTWPSLDRRNDDRDYRITRINRSVNITEKQQ